MTQSTRTRLSSIDGILAPRRPVRLPVRPDSTADGSVGEEAPRTVVESKQSGKMPIRRQDPVDDVTVAFSFTTPLSIRDAFRRQARDHDMPQLYVLFNALDTEAHRLGDLVNAAQPQTRRGSLFARADRSAVELEARVSTTLRITRGNLRVLDRLVTEHEAKDRSQLITAVLQAHFTDD